MTPDPRLSEAVEAVLALLGGPADDVTCELTRSGTMRIVAKRGEKMVAVPQFRSGMGKR